MVEIGSNEEHENCDVFKRGQWKVSRDDVVSFIEDQGSFARNLLNSLDGGSKLKLIKEIGKFIVHVINAYHLSK